MDIAAVLFDPVHLDIFGAQRLSLRNPEGIGRKRLCVLIGGRRGQTKKSGRDNLFQFIVSVHPVGRDLEKILVPAEHVVLHGFLIAVQDSWQSQAEQKQQICEQHSYKEDHVASRILEKDPQTESCGEGNARRQAESAAPASPAEFPAQKLKG